MKKLLPFLFLFVSTFYLRAQELSLVVTILEESCDFTTIEASASGGEGSYTYGVVPSGTSINDSDFLVNTTFNLTPGLYDVYTRANNGTEYDEVTATFSVTFLEAPVMTVTSVNPNCSGDFGGLNVAIVLGTPPYQITLTDASGSLNVITNTNSYLFTDILPNVYTIFVTDALGCMSLEETIVLDNPTEILISAEITQKLSCIDYAEITFEPAIGGTAPYEYGIMVFILIIY